MFLYGIERGILKVLHIKIGLVMRLSTLSEFVGHIDETISPQAPLVAAVKLPALSQPSLEFAKLSWSSRCLHFYFSELLKDFSSKFILYLRNSS